MGSVSSFVDFLSNLTPSFRQARRVRNNIKTQYRKNIRNIESGYPVKTIINHNTKFLGDETEQKHMNVEVLFEKLGERQTGSHKVVSGGEARKKYIIPDEHEKNLKNEMNDVISKIKTRNRISIALESIMYLLFFVSIVIVLLVVSGNLSLIL